MINNQNVAVISEKVAHLESAVANSTSASGISYDNTKSGLTAEDVQDAIDELSGNITGLSSFDLVSVIAGTNVTDAFAKVLELANAYIISGGFTLTGNISANDAIISGINFNGGGSLMCSCPYSSSGILTFLNGTIRSNAGLSSNANPYYFNGIVLK